MAVWTSTTRPSSQVLSASTERSWSPAGAVPKSTAWNRSTKRSGSDSMSSVRISAGRARSRVTKAPPTGCVDIFLLSPSTPVPSPTVWVRQLPNSNSRSPVPASMKTVRMSDRVPRQVSA